MRHVGPSHTQDETELGFRSVAPGEHMKVRASDALDRGAIVEAQLLGRCCFDCCPSTGSGLCSGFAGCLLGQLSLTGLRIAMRALRFLRWHLYILGRTVRNKQLFLCE